MVCFDKKIFITYFFLSVCLTVTHNTICPNGFCSSEKIYPLLASAGKRGILDIIQNPVFLSKANTPIILKKIIDTCSISLEYKNVC